MNRMYETADWYEKNVRMRNQIFIYQHVPVTPVKRGGSLYFFYGKTKQSH